MGMSLSILGKLGVPGVKSLSTDSVYDKYFSGDIRNFENFHEAFLKLCNDFNAVMPGRLYRAPPHDKIEECFNYWKNETDGEKRKDLIIKLIKEHARISETENRAIIMTGLVAPPTAMVVKRAGESVPQLKKFRLNIVPDVVFVPSCTLLALIGVKILQMSNTDKALKDQ